MRWRTIRTVASSGIDRWKDVRGSLLAAAVALYALLSLAPILAIALDLTSLVIDDEVARERLRSGASFVLDQASAKLLLEMADTARSGGRIGPAIVGGVLALWAGSRLFVHIQDALNTVWGVRSSSKTSWRTRARQLVRKRAASGLLVLAVGLVLLTSVLARSILLELGDLVSHWVDVLWLWRTLELSISTALLAALFGAIYRYIPDVRLPWKEPLIGGAVVAVALLASSVPLGVYLGQSAALSLAGVAKVMLGISIWLFLCANLLVAGAVLVRQMCLQNERALEPQYGSHWVAREQAAQAA